MGPATDQRSVPLSAIVRSAASLKSGPMHLFMALALLAANAPEAVVLKPVANMYAEPTEDAEVVSQAIYGTNIGTFLPRNRTPPPSVHHPCNNSGPNGKTGRGSGEEREEGGGGVGGGGEERG